MPPYTETDQEMTEAPGCRGSRHNIIHKGGSDHVQFKKQHNTHRQHRNRAFDLPFFVRACAPDLCAVFTLYFNGGLKR